MTQIAERAHDRAAAVLLCGEVVFVAGLGAAMVIRPPRPDVMVDGLSFYGTHADTVVWFTVALLAITVGALAAAHALGAARRWWGAVLTAIAVLVVPILLTPYTLGTAVNVVHDVFAGLTFFGQFLIAISAAARRRAPVPIRLLALVLLAGDLLALVAMFRTSIGMFIGEVISLAAFLPLLWLLVRDHGPTP